MSKAIKKVTVTSILNTKTGVKDFKFVNNAGTHCNIYVESVQQQINLNKETGSTYLSLVKRGAFIGGSIEDMEHFKEGQILPGKIVKISSFEPLYEGQNPVINPTTEELVLVDGKPYYMKFAYTPDETMQDFWKKSEIEVSSEEVVDETMQGQPF